MTVKCAIIIVWMLQFLIMIFSCFFSEQMGTQILDDLHSQRNVIQRARERVRTHVRFLLLLVVQLFFPV